MKTHIVTKDQVKDGKYIGDVDLSNFDGHIEIEANLGAVNFTGRLAATGYIYAKAGSGIEAGWGIKAGLGIEAGLGIKAGSGIEAGSGIQSQLGITCKMTINCGKRIFAGICSWRDPDQSETEIRCGKLESGEVAFGMLVETGLPVKEIQPDPAQ